MEALQNIINEFQSHLSIQQQGACVAWADVCARMANTASMALEAAKAAETPPEKETSPPLPE